MLARLGMIESGVKRLGEVATKVKRSKKIAIEIRVPKKIVIAREKDWHLVITYIFVNLNNIIIQLI